MDICVCFLLFFSTFGTDKQKTVTHGKDWTSHKEILAAVVAGCITLTLHTGNNLFHAKGEKNDIRL